MFPGIVAPWHRALFVRISRILAAVVWPGPDRVGPGPGDAPVSVADGQRAR